jgi:hypothetical protein
MLDALVTTVLAAPALAEAAEHSEGGVPIWAFPVGFAVAFLFLGYVVFSFRDVANRSVRKPATQQHHAGAIDEYGHPEQH